MSKAKRFVYKMAGPSEHLVDELESSFQNCISVLTAQEQVHSRDSDEAKTCVEMSIQTFLNVAKTLECFFLQKRLLLSIHKPEQIITEDISELKAELLYKDILLERHHEKLAHWQGVMSRIQSVQRSLPVSSGVPPGQHPAAAMPPPPAGAPGGPAFPQQGALAHLEESASNIGMSDR